MEQLTNKEFNLSEKGYENTDGGIGEEIMSFWKSDVKEFIRLLKYKMSFSEDSKFFNHWVDKLAGEKLK